MPALSGRSVPYCFGDWETAVSLHMKISVNQSSVKLQSPPLHSRTVHHGLSEWLTLEPGDISALLQVPNALIVILLGDKVAIGLQRDLLVLSV